MEPDIRRLVEENAAKLDAIYTSVEKTRKYILAGVIMNIVFIVLPLIGLVFAIPAFLSSYSSALSL